jgi:hypothetical protein
VSSTPAQLRRYRWAILSAGVFAQAAFSAILLGLPAIAPVIQHHPAIVHAASWRLAFALAAASPLVGYTLLSPLAERKP